MPDEDRDLTIKRIESLHEVATRTYSRQIERYDQIETKTWRHFALLAFLLGTLTVGIPTFVKTARAASGWWQTAFVGSYVGMLAAGVVALAAITWALRYRKVKSEPFSEKVVQDFLSRRYLDELLSLSKGLRKARSWNGDVLDSKLTAAKVGYVSTVVALIFGVATIVLLLGIEAETSQAILP